MLLISLKKSWEETLQKAHPTLPLNKNFSRQELGTTLETMPRPLKGIFKLTLTTSETLKCSNKSGEGLFSWLLLIKKTKPSKSSKSSAPNSVKSEPLTVQANFSNRSTSLKKLLVLTVKGEIMKLPKTVPEWSRMPNLTPNLPITLTESKDKRTKVTKILGMLWNRVTMKPLAKSSKKQMTGKIVLTKPDKKTLNSLTDTWMSTSRLQWKAVTLLQHPKLMLTTVCNSIRRISPLTKWFRWRFLSNVSIKKLNLWERLFTTFTNFWRVQATLTIQWFRSSINFWQLLIWPTSNSFTKAGQGLRSCCTNFASHCWDIANLFDWTNSFTKPVFIARKK